MLLTRKEILELLQPDPAWHGFDDFVYKVEDSDLGNCIANIHTCWDWRGDFNLPTFLELAKMLSAGSIDYDSNTTKIKITALIDECNDEIIQVPTFLHSDLQKVWPVKYPSTSKTPKAAFVAEDRNHRLTAYALKFLKNKNIKDIPVKIYYGKQLEHHK